VLKRVLVDTYALIAAAVDALTPNAERVLKSIRVGEIVGIIHYAIAYEF